MNKFLSSAILFFLVLLSSGKIFAQTATATSKLSVVVTDQASITVKQPEVTLTFDGADKFALNSGPSSIVDGQLAITCNKKYSVSVMASDAYLKTSSSSPSDIPASALSVSAINKAGGQASSDVKLDIKGQTLITTAKGSSQDLYNVTYKADGPSFINKDSGTYSTTITYTLTGM